MRPLMRSEFPHNVLVILSVARGAVNHGWCLYDGMKEYEARQGSGISYSPSTDLKNHMDIP